jgi:hypothetical protein
MDTNVKPLDPETGTRTLKLALLSSAVAIVCLLFLLMFTWFQPDQLSLADRYFPSPTATHTPTLTPTPTITFTPTLTPTASATPTAYLWLTPAEDVTAVNDTFDRYKYNWDAYFSNNTIRIQDGKLLLQSNQSGYIGIAVCASCMNLNQTFYYQAELLPEIDTSIKYGLAVCISSTADKYYAFMVNSRLTNYSLYKYENSAWQNLIPDGKSKFINKYPAANTLAVYFDHGNMGLYVNNAKVETYKDPNPITCKESGPYIDDGKVKLSVDNVYMYSVSTPTLPLSTATP